MNTPSKVYFNTTHCRGKQLAEYKILATFQDTKIFEFFRRNPVTYATAEDLQRWLMPKAPLTSVRRALTNLFKGQYIKRGEQVDGQYGRPIYTFCLNLRNSQMGNSDD
jgi:hypothetical protein